jgi:cytochrome c peroxidase
VRAATWLSTLVVVLLGLAGPGQRLSAAAMEELPAMMAKFRRPTAIPFPADNPYSDAKSHLGQVLFFDPRLSDVGTRSCASCHNPGLDWRDGLPLGIGHAGQMLPRATPTLANLAWGEPMMWDGAKDGLEDQVATPIEAADELNLPMPRLVDRLQAIAGYHALFQAAFGSATVTASRLAQALATFERTLVSNEAPFDRWIRGDANAVSPAAKRGFILFNRPGQCVTCHSGWRFTDDGFHDIGLPDGDLGRGALLPGEPTLQHAFKTPTLRNVEGRASYMHDGSLHSLREVVVHYDTGFVQRSSLAPDMHRTGFTPQDTSDVIAFLKTLTSADDRISVPTLPVAEQTP